LFNTREGKKITAFKNASNPSKVIPIILNGMEINQIIGYKKIARIARGQHKNNNIHHIKNVNI